MSLLNRLFSKNLSSDTRRSPRRLKKDSLKSRRDVNLRPQLEKLEEKIALAAQAFSTPSDGGVEGGWHTIVLDSNADDFYFRVSQSVEGNPQGGTPQNVETIIFDTDPDFLSNPRTLAHDQGRFQDLFITHGVNNSYRETDIRTGSAGGFFIDLPNAAGVRAFSLPEDFAVSVTPANTVSSQNAIVPGTLWSPGSRSSFSFSDEDNNGFTIDFTSRRIQDENTPSDELLLSLNGGPWEASVQIPYVTVEVATDGTRTETTNNFDITGDYNYGSGVVSFNFSGGGVPVLNPITFTANYASPVIPDGPSTVSLESGRDFHLGLIVDLPGEDSIIKISSPVIQDAVDNIVVLAATNVEIDAPIDSSVGYFSLGSTGIGQGTGEADGIGGNWYGGGGGDTEVERIELSAPVTAPEVGIVIKDDAQTAVNSRGQLLVSSTGSLTAAGSVTVSASYSDIIIEGQVSGNDQSYLFQTRTEAVPFQFITTQGSSSPEGLIVGDIVDVTLSNDEEVNVNESVTHNINLNTDVNSLRIAATGDDSAGTNSTGVVSSVTGLVDAVVPNESNRVSLGLSDTRDPQDPDYVPWSELIQVGDLVNGNTSDGFVASPAVTSITVDDESDPVGSGTIRLGSGVNLAQGSQFTVQSEADFSGNIIGVVDADSVAVGQQLLFNGIAMGVVQELISNIDFDNDILTAQDVAVVFAADPLFNLDTVISGPPADQNDPAASSVSFEVQDVQAIQDTTPGPLATTTNLVLASVAAIEVGMIVTATRDGIPINVGPVYQVASVNGNTVVVREVNPPNPADPEVFSVLADDRFTFTTSKSVSIDFDASIGRFSSVGGIALGMTASGFDASGQVVTNHIQDFIEVVEDQPDTVAQQARQDYLARNRMFRFVDGPGQPDVVNAKNVVFQPSTLDESLPVSFESPTLVVTQAAIDSQDVAVESLAGVAPDSIASIRVADLSAVGDIVVIGVEDLVDGTGVITLSETVINENGTQTTPPTKGVLSTGSTISFSRAQQNDFYRYGIGVQEVDTLAVDATISSGGPVDISAGGDLSVNATLRSHGDISLESDGALLGNAWLVTKEGGISLRGTQVTLAGNTQVLSSPFDESLTDITIEASAGPVNIQGNVNAVNRVDVKQQGTGAVAIAGTVSASDFQVISSGDVSASTLVDTVDITGGGNVSLLEIDQALFEIDAPGRVQLEAGGVDLLDPTDPSIVGQAALRGTIQGTSNIVVSSPRGSVDITSFSPDTLIVGESDLLLTGQSTEMSAAGSVSIRSDQQPITVLDAPIAGFGLLEARAVAEFPITGVYAINNPGVTPSTLTNGANGVTANGNINDSIGGSVPGFGPGQSVLRGRDLILLTGQAESQQNGLYQIANAGSAAEPWVLQRVETADTTEEFTVNSRVRITDGALAGTSYRVQQYSNILLTGSVANGLNQGTPLSVRSGLKRSSNEVTVNYATEEKLSGRFDQGSYPDPTNPLISVDADIVGESAGLVIGGAAVQNDELVLVRHGLVNDPILTVAPNWSNELSWPTNGIYRKVEVLDGGQTRWALQRVLPDAPTNSPAVVVVSEGQYRTSVTGETFTLDFDGLGIVPLTITDDNVGDPVNDRSPATQIGSYDPRDVTNFVVTTSGRTNDAAGSLGKMLSLVQANSATDFFGEPLEQSVQFANVLGDERGTTGTIQLQQELPLISRPFSLDAQGRYILDDGNGNPPRETIVIDGSGITSTRGGSFKVSGTTVNGLEYTAGSGTSLEPVPGLVIPEEATRGVLRGVSLLGFEDGGAIVVDGASNLLLRDITIGTDSQNSGQASLYGVQITGDSGNAGPVTLLDSRIFGSQISTGNPLSPFEGAGVQINGTSQGVQIVGGTIGRNAGSNTSGVIIESTNDNSDRAHSIGVNPLSALEINLDTVRNKATLEFDDQDEQELWQTIGEDLFLGQSVSGTGIASGSEIIYIDSVNRRVVLSERMEETGSDVAITFGNPPGRTAIEENFIGVELRSGKSRMTNTTVANNLVGIRVGTEVPADIWARIGAGVALNENGEPDPKVRSSASNAIHSNVRYGIQFASGITSSEAPTQIEIEGNYIGTDTSSSSGDGNGRADYWWDASLPNGSVPPNDAFFQSLVTDDPTSDISGEDVNGNLSGDLAGEDGVGGGGSGSDGGTGGNDGIVPTPPRR